MDLFDATVVSTATEAYIASMSDELWDDVPSDELWQEIQWGKQLPSSQLKKKSKNIFTQWEAADSKILVITFVGTVTGTIAALAIVGISLWLGRVLFNHSIASRVTLGIIVLTMFLGQTVGSRTDKKSQRSVSNIYLLSINMLTVLALIAFGILMLSYLGRAIGIK